MRSEATPNAGPNASTKDGSARRLVDRFGRVHTKLRVSVTDRCNLRCRYCMPAEGVAVAPRAEILSFEEIARVVRVAAAMGVTQVRLTGGEPLVRRELPTLARQLAKIPGIDDLALTTNAVLLDQQADALHAAGVRRVNISLDALDPEVFARLTRRDTYDRVLAGIEAARRVGFDPIKINAVAIRGVTEGQLEPFGAFARESGIEVRFIEFMPLDAGQTWRREDVLSAAEMRDAFARLFLPLVPVTPSATDGVADSSPATTYDFADGVGRIGFIPSVTEPFCGSCDRFRLTADGQLRSCLFSTSEVDLRGPLRTGATDDDLAAILQDAIEAKGPGHAIGLAEFQQPQRGMSAIGG